MSGSTEKEEQYKAEQYDLFLKSAEKSEFEAMQAQLDTGKVDVNYVSTSGYLALHIAAEKNDLALAKFLINNKANVDIQNVTLESPLYVAAMKNSIDVATYLIEQGANVNASCTEDCDTALGIAASNGTKEMVDLLMNNQARFYANVKGETPLMMAAHAGHLDIVKLLYQFDLITTGLQNIFNIKHENAVYLATENDHAEIVEVLLKAGCDPYFKAQTGQSAYELAKSKGFHDVVEAIEKFEKEKLNSASNSQETGIQNSKMILGQFVVFSPLATRKINALPELNIPKGSLGKHGTFTPPATRKQPEEIVESQNNNTQNAGYRFCTIS